MNNVENFYRKEKTLETVKTFSYLKHTWMFSIITIENSKRIAIEIREGLIEALSNKEREEVSEIISSYLQQQDERHRLEEHILEVLKKNLGESRQRVRKDFEIFKEKEKDECQ